MRRPRGRQIGAIKKKKEIGLAQKKKITEEITLKVFFEDLSRSFKNAKGVPFAPSARQPHTLVTPLLAAKLE